MRIFLTLLLLSSILSAQVKVIFDTDMNGDVDDVGALAMLHTLADRGEVEILACMTSNPGSNVCECVDAINTWYGQPDIPIGAVRGSGSNGSYTAQISEKYPHDITQENSCIPADLYRKVLSEAPDSSVTIITVGFLPNIAALLKSTADEYSDLDGVALVQQKVKTWSCMGGVFPSGSEYNLTNQYAEDAVYAIDNWPGEIIFTGWEIGKEINTGQYVHEFFADSPVKYGYQLYYCSWAFDGNPYIAWEHGHYSWDQTAVLIAARGIQPYWNVVDVGYCHMNADATNEWRTDSDKDHIYVTPNMPKADIAAEIDELMDASPVGAFILKNASAGWLPFTAALDSRLCNPGFGNTFENIQWDLGDGATQSGAQITHEYIVAGTYPITLTVQNNIGETFQANDTIRISDPVFAADPTFGNALSYQLMNANLWTTRQHKGDLRLCLSDGQRRSDDDFNGYCFVKDSSYSDFTFAMDIAPGFDPVETKSGYYKIIFAFEDAQNYNLLQLRPGSSMVYAYQDGSRTRVGRFSTSAIPDDDFHTLYFVKNQDQIAIYKDGQELYSESNELFNRSGTIGFGSDQYAIYYDNIHIDSYVTAVESNSNPLVAFELYQNYPNPFNPTTTIRFQLADEKADLRIVNVQGRVVMQFHNKQFSKGMNTLTWNGCDDSGRQVGSGVYLIQLSNADMTASKKITLMR